MKYLSFIVLLVFLLITASCRSNMSMNNHTPFGAEYFVSEKEKGELERQVEKQRSFDSAYKLALHELFFGRPSQSLIWFELACELGYQREESMYLSVFEQIEDGEIKDRIPSSNASPSRSREGDSDSAREL